MAKVFAFFSFYFPVLCFSGKDSETSQKRSTLMYFVMKDSRSVTSAGVGEDDPGPCHGIAIRRGQEQGEGRLGPPESRHEPRVHRSQGEAQARHLIRTEIDINQ